MSVPGGSSSNNGDVRNKDIDSYFLGLARLASGKLPPSPEERVYGGDYEPKELNPINSSGGFAVISTDQLSVKYPNVDRHKYDVGVVQANKLAPFSWPLYYFEMHVKNGGAKGKMAIGFSSENFKMTRQPGLEADSCAYHGNDGHLYESHTQGRSIGSNLELGQPFTTNDIVGAGINYCSNQFFFTKNGSYVGELKKLNLCPLFPTVSVHSQNEEIEVNFGQKQFSFDIKEYEKQERANLRDSQLTGLDLTLLPQNVRHGLIRSYLLQFGYAETLNSLELDSKSTFPLLYMSQEDVYDAQNVVYASDQRSELGQLIKNGKIDATISKLREWFPQILEDAKSATCFLLYCQKFIELVRDGKLEEASKCASVELGKFSGLVDYDDLIKDCAALLAYEKPMESSSGYLLEEWQRTVVADAVNAMILLTNPKGGKFLTECLESYMERLVRQLMDLCYVEKRYGNVKN